MKKVLSFLLAVFVTLTLAGCSQTNQKEQNQTSEDSKQTVTATDQDILIAYFSYSGNTEKAAQEIQKQTGGQLVEITRKEAYPNDFYDIAENEIINGEQPEITLSINSIDQYDIIFIGYPIWWQKAPAMINTFVHQFDFTDKTVIPFCTSSSDGIEESLDVFDDLQDQANVKEGLRINDYDEISSWLDRVLE
ncbi:flavodoxin [Thomasclavelia saccharogumia]|uniref:flavodoxin n=1 Tax=Thomasclavelia saccharogumia TaxID=341225 RepID=UPI0006913BE4|nr:flavodoxin [Thomasclavelia saccharogumia]